MIFFFKKKPITLYCTTLRRDVLETTPITPASKHFPEWWKKMPLSLDIPGRLGPAPTIKTCLGFIELYSAGAILSLWSDLALLVGSQEDKSYRYQFADQQSYLDTHDVAQSSGEFPEDMYQHFKITSPWNFMCEEEIKFLFCPPTWSLLKYQTINVLPGIVNFKHQSTTNVNLLIKRLPHAQTFLLPVGEPLVHLIPLSDRKLKIVCTDDQDMFKKAFSVYSPVSFTKQYQTYKKLKEQNRNK